MSASLSKSEWDHWCNELGESHQTKIGFCRDNDLNYHQFLASVFNSQVGRLFNIFLIFLLYDLIFDLCLMRIRQIK